MSSTKTIMTENSITVNTSSLKTKEEYVCWLDMMGTKSNMSDSFEKSTNFMLRFHSAVFSVVKERDDIRYYPVMDGVYITCPNAQLIKTTIKEIMTKLSIIFMDEPSCFHKFIIRGSLAYGAVAHGVFVDDDICDSLAGQKYLNYLLFGMPIILAHISEKYAAPYGVYIHESARKVKEFQGRHLLIYDKTTKTEMLQKLITYFEWCEKYNNYLELEPIKIDQYKQLVTEYYTDMRK